MKHLSLVLFIAAALLNNTLSAQEEAATEQQLVKIATLSTVEANQEFQQNVRVMQAARQNAIKLQTEYEATIDLDKKDELKVKIDQAMADLNENNKKMIKAYGFSLNRNYVLVVEKAHIYMQVSPEEAEKVAEKLAKEGEE